MIQFRVAVFHEISGGGRAKWLNLRSILEEARVLDKYLGMFVDYTCFHEKRCTRESRLKQNMTFLVKNRVFGFGFHYFCREFADSMASGVQFAPITPLISATAISKNIPE